jgi:penicillin-insensitive murein endopeptidase
VLDAYKRLADRHPDREWQYGDLGFEEGGEFWPHKTHQAGVSADFFFPVVDEAGEPDHVPISFFNDLGYAIDFTKEGRFEDLRIDWQAMADHFEALQAAGSNRGVSIERIILATALQQRLLREVPRLRPSASTSIGAAPGWCTTSTTTSISDFRSGLAGRSCARRTRLGPASHDRRICQRCG